MDTKHIRFFMRVYEERSINRAAKQMFITPQGLSKIIQHLEEELEAALFERASNGMVPTESGVYFYENSRLILDKLDETKIGIRQIRDRGRKLMMGFSCGVLNVFPLERLEEYRQECGQIEVQWEEASNQEVIDKVMKGIVDIGFVIGTVTEQELWSRELLSRKMNAIVYEGHPLFHRESLSVNDLRGEKLITLNEKYYSYHSLMRRCHDFGFIPSVVIKTMESKMIYRFCRRKAGLGIDVNIHQEEINKINELVEVRTGLKGMEITAEGVVCEDKDGKQHFVKGSSIICALGQRARTDVVEELRDSAPYVAVIGDCAKVATITNAVYQGYHAALDI